MGQKLSDKQIESWQIRLDEQLKDQEDAARNQQRDQKRKQVQAEMLTLLTQFLSDDASLDTFRATFDTKTRTDWNVFGFKGLSGGMFLNTLVKHISDQDEVSRRLTHVLPAPTDQQVGRQQMESFYKYLLGLVKKGDITRSQVQAARAPFFVSAWWHLQDIETWPVYYVSGRRALEQAGFYQASKNPIVDYFAFRDSFQALAGALHLRSWELEHLLSWHMENQQVLPPEKISNGGKSPGGPDSQGGKAPDEVTIIRKDKPLGHAHIQWLLAQIGRKLGCKIWIAANDHQRTWQGKRLGELSEATMPNLGADRDTTRIISLIDVIWLQGRRVAAAFEVEKSTSIFSGLLRMSDLVATAPNLNIPLYIVTPKERLAKVRRELSRPTFQALGLHEQCGFFSFEVLVVEAKKIMQWASDPSAIGKLAEYVESNT